MGSPNSPSSVDEVDLPPLSLSPDVEVLEEPLHAQVRAQLAAVVRGDIDVGVVQAGCGELHVDRSGGVSMHYQVQG